MASLTVTARGQVTLRKDVLQHLGIKPGEKMELQMLPGGQVAVRAQRPQGTIDDVIAMLAGRTTKVATLDEIQNATAEGWAAMKITADTNILVRAVVQDDKH